MSKDDRKLRDPEQPMWKVTIVIWADRDPRNMEIEDVAREAMVGDFYLRDSRYERLTMKDATANDDWPGEMGEFFDAYEEE